MTTFSPWCHLKAGWFHVDFIVVSVEPEEGATVRSGWAPKVLVNVKRATESLEPGVKGLQRLA